MKDSRSGAASAAPFTRPLTSLAGVGPARAAALARLGLGSVGELLFLVPRRLEQSGVRRSAREAAAHKDGEVSVVGALRALRLFRAGRRRSVLSLEVVDESGALGALFFNQPWLFERLRALSVAGKRVELAGRIGNTKRGPALLAPRLLEDPSEAQEPRLQPLYPTIGGIGQELLRRLIGNALETCLAELSEPLPQEVLATLELPRLPEALHALHRPDSSAAFEGARRRLGLERLMVLQARLAHGHRRVAAAKARPVRLEAAAQEALLAGLPFVPTAGQRRVLAEILVDLARTRPMRRLLQGEVGSGKTLVALAACAAVVRGGGQAAFLVPTELLVEQHWLGLGPALERFGIRAVRISGSMPQAARRAGLEALARGRAQLAIGTHALLSPEVRFERLDLCVIDEQQRFGVTQKQALVEKGVEVHTLLMTATPIPRTLALCYYGDLDTSRLKERPPGRGPVETRLVGESQREEVEAFLLARVRSGERAFWVCPRIVPSEEEGRRPSKRSDPAGEQETRAEIASAERTHARLGSGELAHEGLELLHGRLPSERRLRAIERFRDGSAKVLVATSMVEVGLDVPEATVMVVEGAERFGISQLHQLRGRVGRSSRPGWCLLFVAEEARTRLSLLERCTDGFALAEEDLGRRGMGDLAGLRQAGENLEGLGDADRDLALVTAARQLVRTRPDLLERYLGKADGAAMV